MAAAQIELVRREGAGIPPEARGFEVSPKPLPELFDDGPGKLVFDIENVLHFAVETLRPDLVTIGSSDELRGNAHAARLPPHAAEHQRAHPEPAAHIAKIERGRLELKRRCAGNHASTFQFK